MLEHQAELIAHLERMAGAAGLDRMQYFLRLAEMEARARRKREKANLVTGGW